MPYAAFQSESGDALSLATLGYKWSEVQGSISLVDGRTNSAIRFSGGGSYLGGPQPSAATEADRYTTSRAIRVSTFASGSVVLQRWYENNGSLTRIQELRLEADGTLGFYKGAILIAETAAGVFPFDSWVWLDDRFTLYDSGGASPDAVQGIRVGGVDVLNYFSTGTDNRENVVGWAHYVQWGNVEADGNTVTVDVDDCTWQVAGNAFTSTPPVYPSNWLRIGMLSPSGAGFSTQLAVTGAPANWQAVDDIPPDGDTSYVSTATVGDRDFYTLSPAFPGTIEEVLFNAAHRWESAPGAPREITRVRYVNDASAVINRSSGASAGLNTTYEIAGEGFPFTPAAVVGYSLEPWTNTRLARLQLGVTKGQIGGTTVRFTSVFLEVLYWSTTRQRSRAYGLW
jgi:hypothetical protein